MARKLQLNRCWKHVRISIGEGCIEVREHKPRQTFFASIVMGIGLMFSWFVVASIQESAYFESIFVGVVLTILPIAWVLVVYRIPRGLLLYPEQLTARRYFTLYGIKFLSKWYDLRDRQLIVQPVSVYSKEAAGGKTKSAMALTGLFALMGVVGWILSQAVSSNELHERRRTAHAIAIERKKEPLAFFVLRQHPEQVIEMFEAAKSKELEGYRTAPNRFEKRPGV